MTRPTIAQLLVLGSSIEQAVQKGELPLVVPTSAELARPIEALEYNPHSKRYAIMTSRAAVERSEGVG